ncbi:TetR/AcrR family transcriptional regulator [Alistipes sp. ZOR0009]|jgi:AcrR family transcriptional regulator|uniref:TetR/AcrR family transcriptional regulator n=1 Tax=Alistipes sp. ZOR0009 TaxID=1339253 RepID=UPI000690973A|nr:TetR/AcrR family transcriptional regulator [Alistipes sp. ZOR0009]
MVLVTHQGDNSDRLNAILEAAQRRFGMYGYDKVTVSEIAADLSLSKASIYYYFQDKPQLFAAVVEKEHFQFVELVNEQIDLLEDPRDMLSVYLDVNVEHFRKMLNLTRLKHSDYTNKQMYIDIVSRFRQREAEIIRRILQKGVDSGFFRIDDPEKVAHLFLDLLKGLRKISIGYRDIIYLDDEEFQGLVVKLKLFVSIFIKGISV